MQRVSNKINVKTKTITGCISNVFNSLSNILIVSVLLINSKNLSFL